jgi:hypothetical protein
LRAAQFVAYSPVLNTFVPPMLLALILLCWLKEFAPLVTLLLNDIFVTYFQYYISSSLVDYDPLNPGILSS